jgi:hypothetical protein
MLLEKKKKDKMDGTQKYRSTEVYGDICIYYFIL